MLLAAVFFLSLSSLAFEILLARIFSVTQWNHLSFMVISIALFGFGASGTFLGVANTSGWETRLSGDRSARVIIVLYATTAVFSLFAVTRLPLDYFRLPVDPLQALWLGSAYLLFSIPFFFAGTAISLGFIRHSEKAGLVHFLTMAGSACGAMVPAILLPVFGDAGLAVLAALVPLVLVPVSHGKNAGFRINRPMAVVSALLFIVSGGLFRVGGFEIAPSPYKALSQLRQFPETKIVGAEHALTGQISIAESPHIRFAPGISLKFAGRLPPQTGVFTDGDNPTALFHIRREKDAEFANFTLSHAGYLIPDTIRNVLVIQSGGGLAIPCALAKGAKKITVLTPNPRVADHLGRHYGLTVHSGSPRAWLAQSREKFSVIHLENWGASLPGSAALDQDDMFTTDAFSAYLGHLEDDGVVILSRKLVLPPSDAVRMWATARERVGSGGPERHLAMLRNWDTFTLIFAKRPISETAKIRRFAETMNFDLVHMPDPMPANPNRFNIFDKPYHFMEIRRLAAAYRGETDFFGDHYLDLAPQSDNRPFPSRFLKWSGIRTLFQTTGSRFYSLLMSGEVVVAVVFSEALVVTGFLLFFPILLVSRGKGRIGAFRILYFLAIGAGFMFVEIYFIKIYTRVFGHPIIALTVVLGGILIFTGAGAMLSDRVGPRGLRTALILIVPLLAVVLAGFGQAVRILHGLPIFFRYVLAILLLAPPGLLLGFPFPVGIRFLATTSVQRAYAWAANGCASVLTSILAAQIALSFGIAQIMACAVVAYAVAVFCAMRLFPG